MRCEFVQRVVIDFDAKGHPSGDGAAIFDALRKILAGVGVTSEKPAVDGSFAIRCDRTVRHWMDVCAMRGGKCTLKPVTSAADWVDSFCGVPIVVKDEWED
jgi:hypothetical protein